MVTCVSPAVRHIKFADEPECLLADNSQNEALSIQTIGWIENAVPVHLDIPRTIGRNYDLPFDPLMLFCRSICSFPVNIFIYFFCSSVTVVNFVLQTTSRNNQKD
jgi:hypothetical protein